ncbi:DUF1398 family protein [Lactiplantibacillus mudanjiangensis]|uniref:DUF1398 domain-containing protein n=1 Tax=Lactiplantibacillus mudanjiangensis TaxID=1296538 RepID=A0A660DVR0_9LACO|nr:DUF1398 family protein [Lactiplantibacillus mudanjiangensis]VDG23600.1 Hypothetical protein [Lactobacillus plantarum ZJ316] [Lactiplantibacillus mudanjiangensis]VDG27060.1 Hypothetical protein [Lactobacillus plantarum ZJ316] [Lactiplantibacillus mudanjiangensis]
MFKLATIDELLANLGDHTDFATIAKKEADLGIQHLEYDVDAGMTTYFGENGYLVERLSNGLGTPVTGGEINVDAVEKAGAAYIAGTLSLAEAVKALAAAGCETWTANLKRNIIDFAGPEGKIIAAIEF